ncbi:hypothetical protein [Iodidimonas gelatinilytica]|uniref:hypothetical protein n=1 Tax=Iodidimonas gelatinilytica TaxID=1236966 RepID=UPI001F3BDC18|nr:hypothetical protein [Iodidimonas gelatinilytica]
MMLFFNSQLIESRGCLVLMALAHFCCKPLIAAHGFMLDPGGDGNQFCHCAGGHLRVLAQQRHETISSV